MYLIKNPTFYGWTGFTFGLLTYHFSVAESSISACTTSAWLVIPLIILAVLPLIHKIQQKWLVTFFGMIAAGSLFVPYPGSFALGLTSITLMFIPAIITHFKLAPLGVMVALVFTYLLHFFEVIPEVSYASFIFLEVIFIYFYFKNEFPFITWNNTYKLINYQQIVLYLLWISGMSFGVLLFIWVCFITSSVFFPGIISGLILFLFINKIFNGWLKKWFSSGILGSLFALFFFSMILQGFLSRSFGIGFFILALLLWSILSVALTLTHHVIKKESDLLHDNIILEKKLYLSLIIFILLWMFIQIPVCFLWHHKITLISLPESVIDLSVSQYMLKNLTILPAISTILTGLLFLNRKKQYR